jgi:uncharacterized protein
MAATGTDAPHLPRPALIDSYGDGGFRFAGLSHRGSLLCFPDGIWAWPVAATSDITQALLAPVFARAEALDFFLLGAGPDPWAMPDTLRAHFHDRSLAVDVMATGAAVRTYNVLLAENRRVGAGLIAVA